VVSRTGPWVVRANSCKGQRILEKGQHRAKGPNENFGTTKCYLAPNFWNLTPKGPTWQPCVVLSLIVDCWDVTVVDVVWCSAVHDTSGVIAPFSHICN